MTDDTPRNSRERVSRNGFKRREPKLVALAHPDEWRSIEYARERVIQAKRELDELLIEADDLLRPVE